MSLPSTLSAATQAIRSGEVTSLELTLHCLQLIDRHDARLRAWVTVDRQRAIEQAEQLTLNARAGRWQGPLHGVPLGIKDLVDVAGLPTRAGSTLTSDVPAAQDATVVARLRQAGAVILGKTVTTEFACFDPPPTLNPFDPSRTPGGSSSGSAAALAVGMCLGAIGSQTGGSITRPASFCGVTGIKPTFGRTSRAGVVPVSFHLDHVGPMARSVADCAMLLSVIAGADPRDPACAERPGFELPSNNHALPSPAPPRLGILRQYFFEVCERESGELCEVALARLAAAGAELVDVALPDGFDQVHVMHRRIMAVEAADFHRHTFAAPRTGYSPKMAELLDEGFAVGMADYQEALRHQRAFRQAVVRSLGDLDALVTPATLGPAPEPSTTGDARFNSPWSHAGVPTVSFPCGLAEAGLPVALQLIGGPWCDASLAQTGIWCEDRLSFSAHPAAYAS